MVCPEVITNAMLLGMQLHAPMGLASTQRAAPALTGQRCGASEYSCMPAKLTCVRPHSNRFRAPGGGGALDTGTAANDGASLMQSAAHSPGTQAAQQ